MIFKIKKIILLLFCLFFSIYKGKANKKVDKSRKVLVVQMAKLGDMVCTTPMFRAVKGKYPDCEVIVVGNKINKDILEGNSDVNKYIVFNNFLRVVKEVKKENVDFACVTAPDFVSLAILYLANVKTIVVPFIENGYSPYEVWEYKILRKLVITMSHKMGSYAPREYLKLLEPIDIFVTDTKKYLYFSDEANKKVNNYFGNNNINKNDLVIGISPSAGNKIKKWGADKFAELADYIYKKYAPVQKEILDQIQKETGIELRRSDVLILAHLTEKDFEKLTDEQKEIVASYKRGPGYRFCLTQYFLERET